MKDLVELLILICDGELERRVSWMAAACFWRPTLAKMRSFMEAAVGTVGPKSTVPHVSASRLARILMFALGGGSCASVVGDWGKLV